MMKLIDSLLGQNIVENKESIVNYIMFIKLTYLAILYTKISRIESMERLIIHIRCCKGC